MNAASDSFQDQGRMVGGASFFEDLSELGGILFTTGKLTFYEASVYLGASLLCTQRTKTDAHYKFWTGTSRRSELVLPF
jgi:hypothetical protein